TLPHYTHITHTLHTHYHITHTLHTHYHITHFTHTLLTHYTHITHTLHTHYTHEMMLTIVSPVCSFDEKEQNIKVPLLSLPAAHCPPGSAVWDLRSVRSGQRSDRNSSSLSGYSDTA